MEDRINPGEEHEEHQVKTRFDNPRLGADEGNSNQVREPVIKPGPPISLKPIQLNSEKLAVWAGKDKSRVKVKDKHEFNSSLVAEEDYGKGQLGYKV